MKKKTKQILLITVPIFLFLISVNYLLAAEGLQNPLGVNDPRVIVGNVIRAMLGIIGSLALVAFIYGGILWVASGGNEDKIKKGKQVILWATFGLAVVFAAYALVTFIVDALVGGGGGNIPGQGGGNIPGQGG